MFLEWLKFLIWNSKVHGDYLFRAIQSQFRTVWQLEESTFWAIGKECLHDLKWAADWGILVKLRFSNVIWGSKREWFNHKWTHRDTSKFHIITVSPYYCTLLHSVLFFFLILLEFTSENIPSFKFWCRICWC